MPRRPNDIEGGQAIVDLALERARGVANAPPQLERIDRTDLSAKDID